MRFLYVPKFSLWDIIGIIAAVHTLAGDLTLIPEVLVLGFLWILAGVIGEKLTK